MPTSERESAVARRLRELDEEERRLRQSMKQINRRLRRLERGVSEPFDAGAAAAPLSTTSSTRRASLIADKRFASYFASGSFVDTRTLSRERRIQRNKAIFLLICALLMGYIVYRFIF